jgi:hypothetical protein
MSDIKIPHAIATAETTIGGITLRCHILADGRRIIEEESMHQMLTAMQTGELSSEDALHLANWLKGMADA